MQINRQIKTALFIFAALVVISSALVLMKSTHRQEGSKQRLIRYSFSIRNTASEPIEGALIQVFSPLRFASHQQSLKLSSSLPYETLEDSFGNRVIEHRVSLPPFGVKIISIEAQVELRDMRIRESKNDVAPYLKDRGLDLDHPGLQSLANELKKDSPRDTAKAIHDWVANNLTQAQYSPISKGAVYALQNRKGDCTEFASLFTALARINGLPARSIGGFVAPRDMVLRAAEYHNWAEYYDGRSWQLADPFLNQFEPENADYIAFRIAASEAGAPLQQLERFRSSDERLRISME